MLQMQLMINICFNDFRKNQRNGIEIFSRKCDGLKRMRKWQIINKQELN